MGECLECKQVMSDKTWKYCSIACRNHAVSRVSRGNYKRVYMICRECGDQYVVCKSQQHRTKYCSKGCQWEAINKKRVAYIVLIC